MIVNASYLHENGYISDLLYKVYIDIKKEHKDVLDSEILLANKIVDYETIYKVYSDLNFDSTPIEEFEPVKILNHLVHESVEDKTIVLVRSLFEKDNVFPFAISNNTVYFIIREGSEITEPLTEQLAVLTTYLNQEQYTTSCFLASEFDKYLHAFVSANRLTFTRRPYTMDLHFMPRIYQAKCLDLHASDMMINPKRDGIQIGYMVLNSFYNLDYLYLNTREIDEFIEAYWQLEDNYHSDSKPSLKIRDAHITNFGNNNNRYGGRVQHYKNNTGDSSVTRIFDERQSALPYETYIVSSNVRKSLEPVFDFTTGEIIVSGETGSGKSTFLASLLDHYLNINPHIYGESLEKPIEYIIPKLNQLVFGDEYPSLEEALEAFTRRANQLIYQVEVNNDVTANAFIRSAQMSKIIFSTIHTDGVAMIPQRIQNMVSPTQYKMFLEYARCFTHQVMFKKACPHCTKMVKIDDYPFTEDQRKILSYYNYKSDTICVEKTPEDEDFNPNCELCHGEKFLVREPVISMEVLILTNKIKKEIMKRTTDEIPTYIRGILKDKDASGIQDALRYAAQGAISYDKIWRKYNLYNFVDDIPLDIGKRFSKTKEQ